MADIVHANRITATTSKIEVDKVEHYSGATKHIGDFSDPNDIPNRQAVEEIASGVTNSTLDISVPPNSDIPFNVLAVDIPGFTDRFQWQAEIVTDGDDTSTQSVNDIRLDKHYSDNTRAAIVSIDIYGHPNDTDGLTTQDDLIVTLFK